MEKFDLPQRRRGVARLMARCDMAHAFGLIRAAKITHVFKVDMPIPAHHKGKDMKKIALAFVAALLAAAAFAHSGGTDRNGCHHDRQNGGYHCH